jgi:predicted SAM-dependent methyltransferase
MKLHLGCGKRYIPGFIHIDQAEHEHIDYNADVKKLDMIQDGSCSLIYASHVLEYFDYYEAIEVLLEWKRKLKKTGILRLSVPDFEKLIIVYELTNDINKIIGPLFGRMNIQSTDSNYFYHKTVYDYPKLMEILSEVGFKNIAKYDWRERIHKDYDDHSQAYFPHMDKENGIMISLNVEAINEEDY